ncbi:hypothetical protein BD410DRAFT_785494 [Rickenella mellea]|uniref:Nuclear speckle splicing regulatory protein 1 N-terminal domain-containing protein n=1 Tax=Rickenella mellea TaxID=50990 RepID=A0A4Y7QB07_9AGAM|nr:hypothetical protein BD410DRAFT_785494 [Rickenella mellea]
MKVSFSLSGAKAKSSAVGAAPPLKQPTAFASLDDDEHVDAAPTSAASSSRGRLDVNKKLVAQRGTFKVPKLPKLHDTDDVEMKDGEDESSAGQEEAEEAKMSKALRKRIEEEKRVDQTVFEYDEVWDKMQEAKLRQKEAKAVESKERKPKYIANLLQSATTRKLDYIRAEEKAIQREREAEGDEFADKDAFVTQAYKDQMAEVRRAEEEEKRREALEKAKKAPSTGMTHFYAQLLKQSEEQHAATVAATITEPEPTSPTSPSTSLTIKRPTIGPAPPPGQQGQNLTIQKPLNLAPISDAELARSAAAEGKDVELNDDGQIVDKRELLSAGLNLSAPNTRRLGLRLSQTKTSASQSGSKDGKDGDIAHRAVGTAASRKEINERRLREVARQAEEEAERVKEERDRLEREREARVVAKRNTEQDVMSARERYLARKRRKLEGDVDGEVGGDVDGKPPDSIMAQ